MDKDGDRLASALADWEDAPCGLMETDVEGRFLRVNHTFCGWVGRPADELIGVRRLQDLFTVGGRIFHQTHWAPLLQMQGSVSEVKLEIVHAGGQRIPMVLNAIRRERDGRALHVLAAYVARDRDMYERELVLSRRKLEAAVAEATRAQAEARDRALVAEQMMGIVSHDLRNPLSTIHMGAVLLSRTGATEHQLTVLGRIRRATERANRLITDLLDFTQARLGSGLKVWPRPVDLHQLVSDAVDELAQAFQGRGLRHERHGAGPCTADPDRIAQVVGNLVGNAMAYGEPHSAVVVTTRIGADGCAIEVHNRGTPIPPEKIATIFQPLQRGHGSSGDTSVGLGLYIVEQVARSHGGDVRVTSSAEEGTTFRVSLPAGDAAPPAAA